MPARASLLLALLSFLTVPARPAPAPPTDGERLFLAKVRPLLSEKCLACHGDDPAKIKGGLDLRSRAALLRGGDSAEPAVSLSNPAASPILRAIARGNDGFSPMPPKDNDRLSDEQAAVLQRWVAAGAPWPDDARAKEIAAAPQPKWDADEGVTVHTSGGLSADWTNRRYKPENLWAYQPLAKPPVPATGDRNPIDAFINARLKTLGVAPAPLADRATLIRRATFDLLGLPPAPADVDAFVNDPADDATAFARVVDRLLASPHYGERWGNHWLDVVRYADSAGFANDYDRGNAWRYRDYVVRAFNDDKPYDRFVTEQLAGDELDPANPENLVAVGFLRMGPWELTGMEVAKVARQRFLDDVTDAVGQVFLAHAMQCCRCHDHKFDPLPTRDYYGLQAVFGTTQLVERPAPFLATENTAGFEERKYLEQRRAHYLKELDDLSRKSVDAARAWYRDTHRDPAAFEQALKEPAPARARKQRSDDEDARYDAARKKLLTAGVPDDELPPRHAGFTPADFGRERVARKGLERLRWELDRYEPVALSVYDGRTPQVKSVTAPQRMPANPAAPNGELERTCILAGGDPFSPKDEVVPAALSAVASVTATIPSEIQGRRAALAAWITSRANPLTARVMANRLWLWHFDQALAGNPNNFGATGKKPTHPELLDYLAATFMEQGWSIKSVHRLILSSDTYRRSTRHPDPAALAKADPDATGYVTFKPRRLTAEELRDAALAVSGELNPTLGGIPVRPEINVEAAMQPRQVMGTFASAWQPSPLPEQRHRRSIYTLRLRGLRDPMMEVFNQPSPDLSCERRDASTVTPQVFSLFNSRASYDRSLALAHRLMTDAKGDRPAAVAQLFRLTLSRPPTDKEITTCLAHWDQMQRRQQTLTFTKTPPPRELLRDAVEENTGERFTFTEPLESAADFIPDLHPADVDAATRALADLCLVLLNSNEFAYVY